ncbi:MAG: alpha-amylase family protein [Planctomycetota bacterium]
MRHMTLSIGLLLLALSISTSVWADENLLANPGFELGEAGKRPLYWGLFNKGEGLMKLVVAPGGHSGSFEAQMSKGDPVEWVYAGQYVDVRAEEGDVFRFTGWLKASKETKVAVCLVGLPEKGDQALDSYKTVTVGTDWQRFEISLLIKGGVFVRFRPQALTLESNVTVSLDDFELVRAGKIDLGETAPSGETPTWISPVDTVVSDHVTWAKPASGGPLRVLFITHRNGLREIVELSERFDLAREVFATETMTDFALPPVARQDFPLKQTRPEDQEARLRTLLAADYDVIVVGNIKWDILPQWARSAILEKVQAGAGLVAYVRPGNYDELGQLLADRVAGDARAILSAFPYAGLPPFRTFGSFELFCEGVLRFARFGKGRVAVILGRLSDGASSSFAGARGVGEGIRCPERQIITSEIVDPFPGFHMIEYDYHLALAGQLIRWAGGAARPVRVVEPPISVQCVDREGAHTVPILLASEAAREVNLRFALRETDTGTVAVQEDRKASLAAGENALPWKLPAVPAGAYYIDVWVKDGEAVVDYGSLYVEITSPTRVDSLSLVASTFSKGEPVQGKVLVTGALPADKLEIEQFDNFGRCVARLSLPLSPEKSEYPFEITCAAAPLTPLGRVDARLVQGSKVLDLKRAAFTYWDFFPPRDDVRAIIAQGYEGDTYLAVTLARVLRSMGFDTLMTHGGINVYHAEDLIGTPFERLVRPPLRVDPKNVHVGASLLANTRDLMSVYDGVDNQYDWYVMPRGEHVDGPRGPVRRPCLSDPSYERHYETFYAGEARRYRPFAVGEYNLGDESTFVHGDVDVCFSDTCIRAFQDFIRAEYKTIDRLNQEYASNYADWRDVIPIPFDEAKKTGRIPIWIDHRRHMETLWAGYYSNTRRAIEAEVPGALVGYEGSDDVGHIRAERIGGAENYALLARAMTMNGPYYFPLQLDCVRDFSAPGTLIGGGWFGGYSAIWRTGRDALHHRWWIWNTFLRGANSLWVFEGNQPRRSDGYFAMLAPDFSPYDFAKGTLEEIAFAKRGVGKLLMHSNRPDDGVAVLYSPSSMLMTAFEDGLPYRWNSPASASFLFTEAGFQYRMIGDDELESGILAKENFRALYLPYCQALSVRECEQILAFANSGGCVLADLRPGVADEHGKPYDRSPLDPLFGVKEQTSAAKPQKTPAALTADFAALPTRLPAARSDASLALAGGAAKAKVADAPAIVINTFGKGRGVLFNYALSDFMVGHVSTAPSFADNPTADAARRLIQGTLAEAGIRPPLGLEPYIPGAHVWRFDTGAGQVIGLLWDAPGFLPGIEWQEEAKIRIAAQEKKNVTLKLGAPRHLYDIRTGEYLGQSRDLARTLQPGLVQLLAALPYRVTGLLISRGSKGLAITVKTEADNAQLGTHVFHIEVFDPEGKPIEAYAQNVVAPAGRCEVVIPFALDDKPGDWTIRATDVLTGVAGNATVKKENR